MIAASALAILEQAVTWADAGEDIALVTLVGIEGATSRALGTQMAVTGSGRHIGSFSGGCIEGAIVGEAQSVLSSGVGRTVRFGAGSPFIDVRLPCGGGIDLMFTPHPSSAVLRTTIKTLHERQPVRLGIDHDGITRGARSFALDLDPPLRLLVAGQGEDFVACVRLARAYGAVVEAMSPAEQDATALAATGVPVRHLTHASRLPDVTGDAWTAAVLLFHDRDWEEALLPALLKVPAFYRGAVGSRRTHAQRLDRLARAGCDPDLAATIRGPIGLIPATRDPATLAVSVLAEVVAEYALLTRR